MSIIGHGVEVVGDAAARTSIVNPPKGVLVFQLSDNTLWAWAGSAWRQIVYDNSASLTPAGALMSFAGSAAPTGWLLCAGQTLDSITTPDYAALFAVIGTTYGGTGASNFMIPDLRGRTVAGKDNMNGTTASRITSTSGIVGTTLGAAGGNERIQDHTHTFSGTTGNDSPDHYHYYEDTTWMEGTYANWGWRGSNTGWDSDNSPVGFQWGRNTNGASTRHQHGYSGTTANHNQTSGGTSQNMPPTIILNYIIKL